MAVRANAFRARVSDALLRNRGTLQQWIRGRRFAATLALAESARRLALNLLTPLSGLQAGLFSRGAARLIGRLSLPAAPLGELGEREAERYLKRLGYWIVGRQVREGGGELDLVAVDVETIVYVEVKTRRPTSTDERPGEAVDRGKRLRISRAANAFAKRHQLHTCSSRFDIVEIVWPQDEQPAITHWKAAFESELPARDLS